MTVVEKVLSFIGKYYYIIIIAVVIIFVYMFISASYHTKLVGLIQGVLNERLEYLEKDMEKQEKLSKEKEETFSVEKDKEIKELQRKMGNLKATLEKTKLRNQKLIAGMKELKVEREKVKTKEYSTSDRSRGVRRAIELGRQLGQR